MPRNSFLFNNAIYLLPYTGAGSGMSRALEDGLKVEFKNDERSREFVIIIPRKSISDLDTLEGDLDTGLRHSDTQKEDNSSENTSDLDTKSSNLDTLEGDLDTGLRHLDTQRRKISKKEQDIVSFCSVPRSAKEILDRAGVTMHSKNREKYITSLVDAGYLEMTNPENPNASNQKYRKRAK
jgi:hypothetical protein